MEKVYVLFFQARKNTGSDFLLKWSTVPFKTFHVQSAVDAFIQHCARDYKPLVDALEQNMKNSHTTASRPMKEL